MKRLFIAGAVLVAVPFSTFAQANATGTVAVQPATVNPGFIPGDFFYFLDGLTEQLNMAFTFKKEKKAQLHLQYAQERAAEINKVLQNPNASLADIAPAKANFDMQIADAASIVKMEKESGADVADLARQLSDELDRSRNELKDTFRGHQDMTLRAEAQIRAQIDAINASGMASTTAQGQLQGLAQALEAITKEKGSAIKFENDIDTEVSDEQATFEDIMGLEMSAQMHMDQAERMKEQFGEFNGQPGVFSTTSEKLMKEAEAAIKRGDYDASKRASKEAAHWLERAKEMQNEGTKRMQQMEQGMPFDGNDEMRYDIPESMNDIPDYMKADQKDYQDGKMRIMPVPPAPPQGININDMMKVDADSSIQMGIPAQNQR